ncbi:MAG: hypothetical protein AAF555_00305 [Verrucomicrobiota bacterium]
MRMLSLSFLALAVTASSQELPTLSWESEQNAGVPLAEGPEQTVRLRVNQSAITIALAAPVSVAELAPAEFEDGQVPAQAVTAAFGWWAGLGQAYYATWESPILTVYLQEIQELGEELPAEQLLQIKVDQRGQATVLDDK